MATTKLYRGDFMITAVPTWPPHGQPATGRQPRRRCVLFGLAALLFLAGPAAHAGVYEVGSGATTTLASSPTLDLNCNDFAINGQFLTGPGTVQDANDVAINSGGTLDGGSGVINVDGDWTNNGTFIPGTSTVQLLGACTGSPVVLTGQTTFCHLDLSGAGITYTIPAGRNITVNCSLTLGSNPDLQSSSGQTAYITLGPQASYNGPSSVDNVVITRNGLSSTAPIPTLSEYGLIALILLLGGLVARRGRFSFLSTFLRPVGS